ncbi:hypothetical protein SAMN05216200_101448 [Oceanicella actignis]|uniref:Uncharacterized protein n=1 Tax=Oceanicella actignis TaxID=1189325 RepID=A0A1M7S1U2_9RHOB|nr:hypothetical protein SAMN04488119_10270 [Oceanicella actignis]SHN52441.1 hypothetical protein SAMN05216200_101448 [Oceanicella actignis]
MAIPSHQSRPCAGSTTNLGASIASSKAASTAACGSSPPGSALRRRGKGKSSRRTRASAASTARPSGPKNRRARRAGKKKSDPASHSGSTRTWLRRSCGRPCKAMSAPSIAAAGFLPPAIDTCSEPSSEAVNSPMRAEALRANKARALAASMSPLSLSISTISAPRQGRSPACAPLAPPGRDAPACRMQQMFAHDARPPRRRHQNEARRQTLARRVQRVQGLGHDLRRKADRNQQHLACALFSQRGSASTWPSPMLVPFPRCMSGSHRASSRMPGASAKSTVASPTMPPIACVAF